MINIMIKCINEYTHTQPVTWRPGVGHRGGGVVHCGLVTCRRSVGLGDLAPVK